MASQIHYSVNSIYAINSVKALSTSIQYLVPAGLRHYLTSPNYRSTAQGLVPDIPLTERQRVRDDHLPFAPQGSLACNWAWT